jgi:hypothetical protein
MMKGNVLSSIHATVLISVLSLAGCGGGGNDGTSSLTLGGASTDMTTNTSTDTNSQRGCTYTQGYWKSKPNVAWPDPYRRDATFFLSGQTWQETLNSPVSAAPGYYQLAHQYIAAVLNQASQAGVPQGVQGTLSSAKTWLESNTPNACTVNGSCETQKEWAASLDAYNNGNYPHGPSHCNE